MKVGIRATTVLMLLGGLVSIALISLGCGGGGSSSPVSPVAEQKPVWVTPLNEIQAAIQAASGTAWQAGETSVTMGFSQEEAKVLCGMTPDPVLAAVSMSVRKDEAATPSLSLLQLPQRLSWLDKDGTSWAGPVKNQGKFGTCVAFAAIAALEAGFRINQGLATSALDFSEWHLWFNGTGGKSPSPGGWFPSAAADFLKNSGVVGEETCPYTGIPATPIVPPEARRFTITDWSVISGRDALKQALLSGPVLSSMRVWTDFFYYKGGVYSPMVGPELGDHAILLVGYDDEQQCWIAQNSWSPSWGENGFFRVRYGKINDIGIQFVFFSSPGSGQGTVSPALPAGGVGLPAGMASGAPLLNLGPYVRDVTATSAVVCWATDQEATSRVEYGSGPTFLYVASHTVPSVKHSIRLNNLSQETAYQFRVSSVNPNGLMSTSSVQSFRTPNAAVISISVENPNIYGLTVGVITTQTAVISWKTDQVSTGKVIYSIGATSTSTSDLRLTKEHSFRLKNLAGGTRYTYYVECTVASFVVRSDLDFFTTLDSNPPVISTPTATLITGNSANITWKTDKVTTALVEYGLTDGYGYETPINSVLTYGHLVSLSRLLASTTYHYRVRSKDSSNNESFSADFTFNTLDTVAPVLTNLLTKDVTGNAATISFSTNEVCTARVEYGIGTFTAITDPGPATTTHVFNLTGLSPMQNYRYRIRIADTAGNESFSSIYPFSTLDMAFNSIALAYVGATTATVTWDTNASSTSTVDYGFTTSYGSQAAMFPYPSMYVTSHSVELSGLYPFTTYHFRVRSKDQAGKEIMSKDFIFTTLDSGAPTVSRVSAQNTAATTVTVTWLTDKNTSSIVEYGTTTGVYTNQAVSIIPWSLAHSVTLSTLLPGRVYYYRVKSLDADGNQAVSAEQNFETPGVASPLISALQPVGSETFAVISWTTDQPCSSQVEYGITSTYNLRSALDATLVTAHSVTISSLSPLTLYHFRVRSRNGSGLESLTADSTFRTLDTTGPQIYDLVVQSITGNSAVAVWKTNENSDTMLEYGTGLSTNTTGITTYLAKTHSVSVTGLSPNTTYFFLAKSKDQFNNVTSQSGTFTTVDKVAPVISAVDIVGPASTLATITWTTDELSTSVVEYGFTTSYGSTMPAFPYPSATTLAHTVALTGLTGGTTYHFRVRSVDAGGNTGTSKDFTFTTTDTTAPIITSILAQNIGSDTATIVWKTNESADSRVAYGTTLAYASGVTAISLVKDHSVLLNNLNGNTLYHFQVGSADLSGNLASSTDYVFTTADRSPPVITTAATATVILDNGLTVTWVTDEISNSKLEYGLTTSYGKVASVSEAYTTAHSVTVNGLSPFTTYHYRVRSKDPSGNEVISADNTVTTLETLLIQNVQVTNTTDTQAEISWTTNVGAICYIAHNRAALAPGATVDPEDSVPWGTTHSVTVPYVFGTFSGDLYYYQVTASTTTGLAASSTIRFFIVPN